MCDGDKPVTERERNPLMMNNIINPLDTKHVNDRHIKPAAGLLIRKITIRCFL